MKIENTDNLYPIVIGGQSMHADGKHIVNRWPKSGTGQIFDVVINSISKPFGHYAGTTRTVRVQYQLQGRGELKHTTVHMELRMGVDVEGDIEAQVVARLGETEELEVINEF